MRHRKKGRKGRGGKRSRQDKYVAIKEEIGVGPKEGGEVLTAFMVKREKPGGGGGDSRQHYIEEGKDPVINWEKKKKEKGSRLWERGVNLGR